MSDAQQIDQLDRRITRLEHRIAGLTAGISTGTGGTGVTDHGALTGLADDDHAQYHNDARANTWLGTKDSDDLAEGVANLYMAAAEATKLAGIEAGADVTDAGNVAAAVHAAPLDAVPLDADEVPGLDSTGGAFTLIRWTWTGIKAFLKTYFDTLYATTTGWIKADGTVPLTGDWDIGTGRKISAATIAARDASGWTLTDDGGNEAAKVLDGGYLSLTGAVRSRIKPETSIGLTGGKSVNNNSATSFCTITPTSMPQVMGVYLLSFVVTRSGGRIGKLYALTFANTTSTLSVLSESLFGFTSLTVTVAADGTTGAITITVTQVNAAAVAATVTVNVTPLQVGNADPLLTLAML